MRVLHVLEALEGGTARHLRDLVRFTPDVEQHVAVPRERIGGLTDLAAEADLRAQGAAVHVVPMTRRPPSVPNARAVVALVRLIRAERIDLVHGHSSVGGALARLAATAARVPAVYTPNGLHDHPAALLVERVLGAVTARLIAVSPSEAALVRRHRLVPEARLRVVRNGIDPEAPPPIADLRALAGVPPTAPFVVSVGRLVRQKDPQAVVRTLAFVLRERPDAHALLVGDGDLAAEIAALLRAIAEPRLHHLPVVDGVASALGAADVVLLLSRFEGAPYVPLEAMRVGVPVVATDVVGSRDTVVDGRTGLLVPVGDDGAAAEAVLRLLDDPDLRDRLGAAGRFAAATEHSAITMGAAHRELYCAVRDAGVGHPDQTPARNVTNG